MIKRLEKASQKLLNRIAEKLQEPAVKEKVKEMKKRVDEQKLQSVEKPLKKKSRTEELG